MTREIFLADPLVKPAYLASGTVFSKLIAEGLFRENVPRV